MMGPFIAGITSSYCLPCPPGMYCNDGIYAYKITSTNDITFFSETPVMTGTVNLYTIYYGDFSGSVGDEMKTLINDFSSNLGGSDYYNTMSVYYQIIGGVRTNVSNSIVFKGAISVEETKRGGSINTATITNLITSLISSNKLPLDPNGIYGVIFRGDIAFHDTFTPSSSWGTTW